jgi:enoyl-CoA hydratase/carnithine racemase
MEYKVTETENTGSSEHSLVLYKKADNYAIITINRPDVLNAINSATSDALLDAFTKAESDEDIRAIILNGSGRAFSAGGDMQESSARILAANTEEDTEEDDSGGPGVVHMKIWDLSKPVIAAVHGYAIGQAFELAAVCDFTVMADDAKVGEIQIRHGYGPPVLMTPYVVSLKRAKEILLLGDTIDAKEALIMGLVNRVVPETEVLNEAISIATRIASLPRKTVEMNKALINRSYELSGFKSAINYREDPNFADLWEKSQTDSETQDRLKVLQEKGWEAFRNERDANYHGRTVDEEKEARERNK